MKIMCLCWFKLYKLKTQLVSHRNILRYFMNNGNNSQGICFYSE